jgi:hypothetical protein
MSSPPADQRTPEEGAKVLRLAREATRRLRRLRILRRLRERRYIDADEYDRRSVSLLRADDPPAAPTSASSDEVHGAARHEPARRVPDEE